MEQTVQESSSDEQQQSSSDEQQQSSSDEQQQSSSDKQQETSSLHQEEQNKIKSDEALKSNYAQLNEVDLFKIPSNNNYDINDFIKYNDDPKQFLEIERQILTKILNKGKVCRQIDKKKDNSLQNISSNMLEIVNILTQRVTNLRKLMIAKQQRVPKQINAFTTTSSIPLNDNKKNNKNKKKKKAAYFVKCNDRFKTKENCCYFEWSFYKNRKS